MESYLRAAVERAMKVQEVILRALSGRQSPREPGQKDDIVFREVDM